MKRIKLFEAFVKGSHNYDEITIDDMKALTPDEVGWMVWSYPPHQPRAWGQWEEKQPDKFRTLWQGMLQADMKHGIADDDSVPMGKYLLDKKNIQVLNDLILLFNRKYPGVDYIDR